MCYISIIDIFVLSPLLKALLDRGAFLMPKGVSQGMRFQITKDRISCTWVVYRVNGEPHQHCHMKKIGACKRLIKILKQGDYPYSPWMRESARRLLTDSEYRELKKPKDRYINQRRR